ncbi:MAG: YqzL family protein [Tenericutes bacterium]|nr:YqzL family protein [Mycoplasmatota bacterium]MDD6387774.1 YqzL family protein [Bacilli bacterium]
MKKQLLWDLFKNTGKIEYYMKYKELERERSRDR